MLSRTRKRAQREVEKGVEVKEQQEKGGKRGMPEDLAKNPSQSWGTSRAEIRGD